jgi:hypothetical protein
MLVLFWLARTWYHVFFSKINQRLSEISWFCFLSPSSQTLCGLPQSACYFLWF